MISSDRLKDQMIELVKIDSESKNEKNVGEHVVKLFEDLGLEVEVDNAGENFGSNYGNIYAKHGLLKKSIAFYRKAIDIKPEYTDALLNYGNTMRDLGEIDAAFPYVERVIELEPENAYAHLCLSFLWLMKGDFKKGLKAYEWRLKIEDYRSEYPYTDRKLWNGKPFWGKPYGIMSIPRPWN